MGSQKLMLIEFLVVASFVVGLLQVTTARQCFNRFYMILESDGYSEQASSRVQTRAVVHMGPAKTGTSTIQVETGRRQEELREDGYEMPWKIFMEEHPEEFASTKFSHGAHHAQLNFARCFAQKTKKLHCIPELLAAGSEIADRRKNLLVSAENFDAIRGTEISMLKAYLSQWDQVMIVVYYRRFYEWLVSFHNQFNKRREPSEMHPILDDIASLLDGKNNRVELIQNLRKHFDESEVVVRNFHDDSDEDKLSERFFCEVLPDAKHTCDAIAADAKPLRMNKSKSVSLDSKFLIGGAQKAGLVEVSPEEVDVLIMEVQNHQEGALGLTSSDFPRICPSSGDLERLWDISLGLEKALFPDKFRDREREDIMRNDFEKVSKTSLCALDVERILAQETWRVFFESYLLY